MQTDVTSENRRGLLLSLIVLGLAIILVILPYQFRSAGASEKSGKDFSRKTESHEEGLENYDIRADKTEAETLVNFRQSAGKDAFEIADVRDKFVAGENALRQKIPTLKIEYNTDIRTPEVIALDVFKKAAVLTSPSTEKRPKILRNFAKQNNDLIGITDEQINRLKVTADYANPDGNLSFAYLEQTINDVPVFRGEVKAGFNKNGEMFRVVNNLAPGLDYENLSSNFGEPLDAVKSAARSINYELKETDLARNEAASTNLKTVFGEGDWATTAEKMYFPTEPGVARPAWRVLIWQPVNAYYVIVDGETGKMLWRKNITEDQTTAATYNVYANTTSLMKTLDSPAPITPGPIVPNTGTQGIVQSRTDVTLIGNEPPYTFNNNGWITDGTNGANGWTDGNAVEAGLDIDGTNGVDAPVAGTNRVFNFNYNPPPGNPPPSENAASATSRSGGVTQLFYINNRYHDEMYLLGFTEAARNFQHTNFSGQGTGNDRVSAESQDSSGSNNANFATPADGGRGRMQMFLFGGQRDSSLDADIVIHEYTHGLSNRLIGNASGLTRLMSRGMGEGWSDFYAVSMLSEPTDPVSGIYSTGAYSMAVFNFPNSYYGTRRFPYAIMAFTGGANNRPHNPVTFADINSNCSFEDGAFPPSVFTNGQCNLVHNEGEIWSSALWEVRALMIQRLGWATGNRKMLQIVTDGMKLSPLNPSFLQGRDAIVQTARNSSGFAPEAAADAADVKEGFRIRGMGFSAVVINPDFSNGTAVIEAFDKPNVIVAGFSVSSDAAPGGNGNGVPEPGETVTLTVPLVNSTGDAITGVTASITGGGNNNYGDIADSQTVSRTFSYTIPNNVACGSLHTLTINIDGSNGQRTETRQIRLGQPLFSGTTQNFDSLTPPALPGGWTESHSGANTGWETGTFSTISSPNYLRSFIPTYIGYAEVEHLAQITAANAQLKFFISSNSFDNGDGTVLEIKIGNGSYQDIIAAGGSFVSGGYTGTITASSGTPLSGRPAWIFTGGASNTIINLPASANGQTIGIKWRTASDSNDGGFGFITIDNVQVVSGQLQNGNYQCSSVPTAASVSVGGRVFSGKGRGVANARVTLTDTNGATRLALTNAFGYYRFETVAAGETYIFMATHKRYQFPTQVVSVTEELTELNFTAEP